MNRSEPQPFLPRYEVITRLGEGGVGTVYMVRDVKERSVKALKALKHARQNPYNIQRFEEEYRILRSLRHPSLATVFDYGVTSEDTRYIVMDFLEGEELDAYFSKRKDELWILLFQLSEALAFIHEHKLLHLDLKPSNIIVRRTRAYGDIEKPLAMLLDFGVSYRRETGGRDAIVGTPGYMAPEVIRNDEELTRAADYYSLGATLYELIEGTVPFRGKLNDVLRAHLSEDISFETQAPEYIDLYPHIRSLMHKDPRRRLEAFNDFRSAVAMKVSGDVAPLEQAYGIGYLDSLGVIGKTELWQQATSWARDVAAEVSASRNPSSPSLPHGGRRHWSTFGPEEFAFDLDFKTGGEAIDDECARTTAVLSEKADWTEVLAPELQPDFTAKTPSRSDLPRCFVISGAAGSGKSFLVDALKAELQIGGVGVIALDDPDEYDTITAPQSSTKAHHTVDPQSLIIDRFVRGWEYLREEARHSGAVIIIDGYERTSKEVREFLEYVGRRLELIIDEGDDPQLFVLVTGRSPRLKRDLEATLPRRGIDATVVPPPGRHALERIIAQFHGHMPGVDDRRRLKDFLSRRAQTSGSLVGRLKDALLRGDLTHAAGKWRFSWTPSKAQTSDAPDDYYRTLLEGLDGAAKEVIQWLCCNPSPIYLSDLFDVSGIPKNEFDRALEQIQPYRVVELRQDDSGTRVGMVSMAVRKAFYNALDANDRARIHAALIEHLRGTETRYPRTLVIYHYEQMGNVRAAVRARLSVLRELIRERDVFRIRQSCAEGVAFIRAAQRQDKATDLWHLERYFVKQWIAVDWWMTNFKSIVETINLHVTAHNRDIPLSFCYKYATALERTGELKMCRELITATKKRMHNAHGETDALISLVDASVLHATGAYDASVKALDRIAARSVAVDATALARMYILYMLNYENLGVRDQHERYMTMGERLADKDGLYEQSLTVSFTKALSFFNRSLYTKAKQTLRHCIRMASKHRVYRRLCSMYFLSSAVYYEEGNYKSAIKYLDKAIHVALNMGMRELVNDYMLRYALIYQNIGHYGNAIRYADNVKNQVSQEYRSAQYFFALLILFDLHIALKNDKAAVYKEELDALVETVEAKYRLALYHFISGDYYYDRQEFEDAYREYELAHDIYTAIQYDDDAARCWIRMTHVLIDEGRHEKANDMLGVLKPAIKKMESEDLRGEYHIANLALHLKSQKDVTAFDRHLETCEENWPQISDINIRMHMHAILFRAYAHKNERELAIMFFNQYYMLLKQVTNNLRDRDYVDQLIRDREFVTLVQELKTLTNKNPNQPIV